VLTTPRQLTIDQSAALRLEGDADETILSLYSDLSSDLTGFFAAMSGYLDRDERMPMDEWKRRVEPMEVKAQELIEAARQRLGELETPPN
jgi:hypothetical protein